MTHPIRTYIGLGANLGDRERALNAALAALGALAQTQLRRCSSFYRSESQGAAGPDYLNAVAELATGLAPTELLEQLQRIERDGGRERSYRNAPRTIDLDLLLYGDAQIATPALTVPHPRLHERAFVLRPLAEIAPALAIPGLGDIGALLAGVSDQRIDKLAR